MRYQPRAITRQDRERQNGQRAGVIWFTGLSGAGKTTLANALEATLHDQGQRTYTLDGDTFRSGLCSDLGFSAADREENIRRLAEVSRLMVDAGLIVMTAFISPFRRDREFARHLIGPDDFFEIHVSTPLEVCEQRDVKGLYRKARAGLLPEMTGIGSRYEAPESPHLAIDTSRHSPAEAIGLILDVYRK